MVENTSKEENKSAKNPEYKVLQSVLSSVLQEVQNQLLVNKVGPPASSITGIASSTELKQNRNNNTKEHTLDRKSESIKLKKQEEKVEPFETDEDEKMGYEVLGDSLKIPSLSYQVPKSGKDLACTLKKIDALEKENKQLRHRFKCVEANYGLARKNLLIREHKPQENESKSDNEIKCVRGLENHNGIDGIEEDVNLNSLNSQLDLLTNEMDKIHSKKIRTEDDMDLKDSQILSLRSVIDKMKIMILECKSREHNLNLQLEYSSVSIDKLQRALSGVYMGQEKSSKNLEQIKTKAVYLQNQYDGALTVSKQKDDEIKILKKEKSVMADKLKEKSVSDSTQQKDNERMKAELFQLKEAHAKIDECISNVKKQNHEQKNESNILRKEKRALETRLKDTESKLKDQMEYLLGIMNVTEADLKGDLKGFVEELNICAVAEIFFCRLRSQVEMSKSKIGKIKEALEISSKERASLHTQLIHKDEHLVKLQTKLGVLEEANQDFNQRFYYQEKDYRNLQNMLEKAVVTYENACVLFEKQEDILRTEREIYNKELTKVQKVPKKACTGGGSPVQLGKELRLMLTDLKSHLSSTLSRVNGNFDSDLEESSRASCSSNASVYREEEAQRSMQNNLDVSEGSNTQRLNFYLERHESEMSQTSSLLSTVIDKTLTDETLTSIRNNSPKSRLFHHSSLIEETDLSPQKCISSSSVSSTANGHDSSISTQSKTTETISKLKDRLNHLHHMGTNLQSNNSELCEMMKSHSKKVKCLKNLAKGNTPSK